MKLKDLSFEFSDTKVVATHNSKTSFSWTSPSSYQSSQIYIESDMFDKAWVSTVWNFKSTEKNKILALLFRAEHLLLDRSTQERRVWQFDNQLTISSWGDLTKGYRDWNWALGLDIRSRSPPGFWTAPLGG